MHHSTTNDNTNLNKHKQLSYSRKNDLNICKRKKVHKKKKITDLALDFDNEERSVTLSKKTVSATRMSTGTSVVKVSFDNVFDADSSQEDVFTGMEVAEDVKLFIEEKKNFIYFNAGATNAGKVNIYCH